MAENPFDQFDAIQPSLPAAQIKPIIAAPVKPEKGESAPSGYRYNAAGVLEPIPGGPADPNAPKPGAEKPTEAQGKVLTLLTRVAGGASDIQNTLKADPEAQQAGLLETLSRNVLGEGVVTRTIAGPERRIITDAQADILDGLLTLGTGAAYSREQLIGQTISYFPQYGDTKEEIAVKNDRLQRLITAARIQAGPLAAEFDKSIKPLLGETAAPPAEGAAPPPPAGAMAPIEASQAVQTEQDITKQQQLQQAWNSGATVEQMVQLSQQLGVRPFGEDELSVMRSQREKGGPVNFYVEPTGTPSITEGAAGAILSTPVGEAVGGYATGAANALLLGGLDELAPVLGLSPQQVQAGKDYLRQQAPVASLAGEVTGGVIGALPLVRGAQAGLAGTRLAGAAPLLGETAYGALYGAGEAPEGQRLAGAAVGGGLAAGAGALANRFLPGGPGTFTGVEPPAAAPRFAGQEATPEQIIEGGRQAGVRVLTSDIRPPETFMGRITEQVGEIVPFGTAGARRTQQESREQAVENILADNGITIDRDISADLVQNLNEQRSSMLSKYVGMKREVIDQYASAGDVPAKKSLDAIDQLIANLQGENLPRQLGPLIQQLQDVKNSLSGPGNLQKIESNRGTLFDLKADPNLANISTKSEKAFKAVYDALNEDMGDFIKANGNMRDFNRWKVANVKLAKMADELTVGSLKNVLNKGEFDPNQITRMLTSTKPEDVRTLFGNLSREGRANARLLLLQTAAQKALDVNTGTINPNTFAREVGKLKSNFSQFFGGEEAKRVNGLVAVLNATRRAQEAGFAPRTGERLVPFATAGSFGGLATVLGLDFTTGLLSTAAFGAARQVYESPAVRNLLIKIGNATGTEKAKLIADLTQRISAAAAPVAGTQAIGPEGEPPEGAIVVRQQ